MQQSSNGRKLVTVITPVIAVVTVVRRSTLIPTVQEQKKRAMKNPKNVGRLHTSSIWGWDQTSLATAGQQSDCYGPGLVTVLAFSVNCNCCDSSGFQVPQISRERCHERQSPTVGRRARSVSVRPSVCSVGWFSQCFVSACTVDHAAACCCSQLYNSCIRQSRPAARIAMASCTKTAAPSTNDPTRGSLTDSDALLPSGRGSLTTLSRRQWP